MSYSWSMQVSYNGTGTFLINTAGQPVVASTVISATTFNLLTADLANGLTNVITKDGQTTVTANIPMSNFKITGLGAATTANDAVRLEQLTSGATNVSFGNLTYTGTLTGGTGVINIGSGQIYKDASGNVGIGTSSPITQLDVNKTIFARPTTTAEFSSIKAVASNYLSLPSFTNTGVAQYGSTATGTTAGLSNASLGILEFINGSAALINTNGSAPIVFGITSQERMRIDTSGNLLVGTNDVNTVLSAPGIRLRAGGTAQFTAINASQLDTVLLGVAGFIATFNYGATLVGSISTNGSTTAFNTTSDYRLKENVSPMTGALATVAALKPCTYTWKADGSASQGFIAHELQSIVPDCVTGEKDALDKDGKPKYQGIDVSFLVATLTAAIQEQQALIQDLTIRLNTLEGN